jgi:hypothetical protein
MLVHNVEHIISTNVGKQEVCVLWTYFLDTHLFILHNSSAFYVLLFSIPPHRFVRPLDYYYYYYYYYYY